MPSVTEDKTQRQIEDALEDADGSLSNPDEGPIEPDPHVDRMRTFSHTSWARMRTQWGDEDRLLVDEIKVQARRVIRDRFKVSFDLIDEIYLTVRKPLADRQTGEVLVDLEGRPRWEQDERGNPVEDWSRLGDRKRNGYLDTIAIHLFDWELAAAEMWGESMFAKGKWEEAFAAAYMAANRGGTVQDKTQRGHSYSMEHRYFAIFTAVLSKQAEAVVRSMNRIQGVLENTARRL